MMMMMMGIMMVMGCRGRHGRGIHNDENEDGGPEPLVELAQEHKERREC
jgi:hypothetical protein